ncbi:hypothetical protein [Leptospira paudalimensis]|uniref:Uncharacterized protein n=1 Tax=Leptospira paudalimensis TaxID=2950024 RepID=A0ABT3MCL4_9LEPT|nr:hypothetical protein [Leptospira paudalimensis]MCW7506129.1 hypothetical protein [Leptospira paudalimensis]
MDPVFLKNFVSFVKKNIKLDFDDDRVMDKIKKQFGKEYSDFEELLKNELVKEEYKELIQKFSEYGPAIMKKLVSNPEAESYDESDYSILFSNYGFGRFFKKNEENFDLCEALFYIINSLSSSIDSGECNRIIERLSENGKLHLIQIHHKKALRFLYENDPDYLFDRLAAHVSSCQDQYPERIRVFKNTQFFKDWQKEIQSEESA